MSVRRANDATNHVTVAEKHLQTMQRAGDTSQRRRRRHRAKNRRPTTLLLLLLLLLRETSSSVRPSVRPLFPFLADDALSFIRVCARPSNHAKEEGGCPKDAFENFWKKRSFLFALVHLGSRSFFESLNVNSHIFASLFWDCFGKRQQQKKRRGRINLIADTANRHPKKPPSRELEKDGRRADSSADSKKELSFSARFFCCCCWTRFTGKKPFGRENCDRPLFRVRVRRIALFEPKKKSVTNTFRGTESVRKRARAGLHRTSRVFRVEITRGFIERTRRRAGASFARRSKAEGNARVFARRDESNRRKKSSLFRCVGIFF